MATRPPEPDLPPADPTEPEPPAQPDPVVGAGKRPAARTRHYGANDR